MNDLFINLLHMILVPRKELFNGKMYAGNEGMCRVMDLVI